jgi:hypothetical protein
MLCFTTFPPIISTIYVDNKIFTYMYIYEFMFIQIVIAHSRYNKIYNLISLLSFMQMVIVGITGTIGYYIAL